MVARCGTVECRSISSGRGVSASVRGRLFDSALGAEARSSTAQGIYGAMARRYMCMDLHIAPLSGVMGLGTAGGSGQGSLQTFDMIC